MPQDSDGYDMIMSLRDWRQAIRTPTAYRVGNSTLRIQTQYLKILAVIVLILVLVIYTFRYPYRSKFSVVNSINEHARSEFNSKTWYPIVTGRPESYNATYPLTAPIRTSKGITFRIGIISDMDKKSKSVSEDNTWISILKKGYLMWNPKINSVSVKWDPDVVTLKSNLGEGGRGMELSELITFNARLYAVDDRTGVIYELDNDKVIPWVMLPDGDGRTTKGFKMEWAAVKEHVLYVGGLGKEWTSGSGDLINYNPQWIKIVTPTGEVSHINWREKYNKIRKKIGIDFPGYMIHEAICWSQFHKKWFILPRRASKDKYNEDSDNEKGTNLIISANENFDDIQVTHVGEVIPTHGFSSFKFVPGTDDEVIVALKTMETAEKMGTFIMAFTISGKVLLEETLIADMKYEGIEFI